MDDSCRTNDDKIFIFSSAGETNADTFGTIAVSGEASIVADANADTLTFVEGANIDITTSGSEITIAAADAEAFSTIAVTNRPSVVADAASDTLTLVDGSEVTITTNATNDSITIASHGVQSLRVEDLSDYEADTEITVATTNFLGEDNLADTKYIPANRSSTPFGELHIEYASAASIDNANIPVVGDFIGGSTTIEGTPSWSGTVYKRISYIDDLQRLYVRLAAVPADAVFGTTQTYLAEDRPALEKGYENDKLEAQDNSIILFDTTDEEWKPTQLVGFDISTLNDRQVVTAPQTEVHLSFHELEDYEPASQFVAADTTTAGEFFTTTIFDQAVYRTAGSTGTENGTLELLFTDPGNEDHLAPLQLGTYIGGSPDEDDEAVWQGIIYEYRDFPAPNNQLRLRVRLTTAPTTNFLGNGNDLITLNNVTEEFERGYRTDAIDPLGNSIFAYDFEAKEWQPITTHGINFHTETIIDSAGNSVDRKVASVPVPHIPAVEDLSNYNSDINYRSTSNITDIDEFFGSTLTDFSAVFQSAASTGTGFGQLFIYYSEIDEDGIRDTLETFTAGSYIGGGVSGGSEPTWLSQITSIAFAGQDGAATMVLRLTTDAPDSFGSESFNLLDSDLQLADIQEGYVRRPGNTAENSVLVYTTYTNQGGDEVEEWVPHELVGTVIDNNQSIPSGTVYKRIQDTAGDAITIRTGNTIIIEAADGNIANVQIWMYVLDDDFTLINDELTNYLAFLMQASSGFVQLNA